MCVCSNFCFLYDFNCGNSYFFDSIFFFWHLQIDSGGNIFWRNSRKDSGLGVGPGGPGFESLNSTFFSIFGSQKSCDAKEFTVNIIFVLTNFWKYSQQSIIFFWFFEPFLAVLGSGPVISTTPNICFSQLNIRINIRINIRVFRVGSDF